MAFTFDNRNFLLFLLFISSALLIAGFLLPMMTITKLVFFSDRFSLLVGIYELFLNANYFLFVIVGLFSVILPLVKLGVLFRVLTYEAQDSAKLKKLVHIMHEYGRWAMLDVMVVAVLIMTVKLGAIASIEVHTGLYVFGLAVLMIMFITSKVVKLTKGPELEASS